MITKRKIKTLIIIPLGVAVIWLITVNVAQAGPARQQPTVDIPTVTGSPSGPIAVVNADQDQINVRSGPSTDYPIVGVLVAGQHVAALGRSPGGDWVMVAYPGIPGGVAWVYSYLITMAGNLPVVEPPPTTTPRVTPTIDPTLAAQFVIDLPPTRLPTFTPPPALVIPTYTAPPPIRGTAGVPMGFIIIGLAVVGLFGVMISFFSRR